MSETIGPLEKREILEEKFLEFIMDEGQVRKDALQRAQDFIAQRFLPEEVFTEDRLEGWALDNGWVDPEDEVEDDDDEDDEDPAP